MLSESLNASIISQEKKIDGTNKFELVTRLILK